MNKLTKLLVLSSIASATLFANDNLVIDFEKKRLSQNPNVKASNIKIFYKKELEAKGWYGYVLDFDAVIQDKNMKVKDTLFSDGKVVATDLFDITTSKSLKSTIVPNITDKYYQKSKLVAGSEKAKDKIVIFITHRMAHCKESQLTFVMKEGRLIQQGSYEELFNQANLFRELVENQKNLERIIENER